MINRTLTTDETGYFIVCIKDETTFSDRAISVPGCNSNMSTT